MNLLVFILGVMLIGLGMWAINTYVPMTPGIKKFLNVAVVIVLIIYFLYEVGLLDSLGAVGRIQLRH